MEMPKSFGLLQHSGQLPMDLTRLNTSDMTHLVELLGGPTVMSLCTLFQKFPGRLCGVVLCCVCQDRRVVADVIGWLIFRLRAGNAFRCRSDNRAAEVGHRG